jgi:hypothetical protein
VEVLDFGESEDGWWRLAVFPATTLLLDHLLEPNTTWVVLKNHSPVEVVRWAKLPVPLVEGSTRIPVSQRVRNLAFDALMKTSEFFDILPDLKQHGIHLWQMNEEPASTIDFARMQGKSRLQAWTRFGVRCEFQLPHAGAVGVVTALHRDVLEMTARWINTADAGLL